MLKIYTNKNKINNNKETIEHINAFFDIEIKHNKLTNEMMQYMDKFDNAKIVSDNIIITPFGACNLKNLSAGTKTIILMLYFKDKFNFDVTSCGPNILIDAFKIADKFNISLVLRHTDIPFDIECDSLFVDDEAITDGFIIENILKGVGSYV